MNQIMISTFNGVFVAVIFYGIYCSVRNNKFNLIKVVLVVYLFLAFLPLINMLRSEEFDIFVKLLNIILIFCIIFPIYKKDIQFKEIYKSISSIEIIPIIVLGISNIALNDIEYFNEKIKNISNVFCRLKKKYVSYIRYNDEILEISLIITDIQDFNELCSLENQVENILIKNVEPSPKGGSLTIGIQK